MVIIIIFILDLDPGVLGRGAGDYEPNDLSRGKIPLLPDQKPPIVRKRTVPTDPFAIDPKQLLLPAGVSTQTKARVTKRQWRESVHGAHSQKGAPVIQRQTGTRQHKRW